MWPAKTSVPAGWAAARLAQRLRTRALAGPLLMSSQTKPSGSMRWRMRSMQPASSGVTEGRASRAWASSRVGEEGRAVMAGLWREWLGKGWRKERGKSGEKGREKGRERWRRPGAEDPPASRPQVLERAAGLSTRGAN